MKRRLAAFAAAAVLAGCLAACSSDDGDSTTLTVFAASSLTGAFSTLEKDFEKQHPGVDVVFSFGSSTTLAQQVTSGAPADVIATADQASIGVAADAGDLSGAPQQFATNTLVIAVPEGNPGDVTGVGSLNDVDYVACDDTAPCGAAAKQMLTNAGITNTPKTFEPDVATTLTTVESGEVDAGIVYVTDAEGAADKVDAIQIPADVNVVNPYFIAAVKGSDHADLADEWLTFVTGTTGQRVLREAGFGS